MRAFQVSVSRRRNSSGDGSGSRRDDSTSTEATAACFRVRRLFLHYVTFEKRTATWSIIVAHCYDVVAPLIIIIAVLNRFISNLRVLNGEPVSHTECRLSEPLVFITRNPVGGAGLAAGTSPTYQRMPGEHALLLLLQVLLRACSVFLSCVRKRYFILAVRIIF